MSKIARQHVWNTGNGNTLGNLWRYLTGIFKPAASALQAAHPNDWLRHDAEAGLGRPQMPVAADRQIAAYGASFDAMLNRNI